MHYGKGWHLFLSYQGKSSQQHGYDCTSNESPIYITNIQYHWTRIIYWVNQIEQHVKSSGETKSPHIKAKVAYVGVEFWDLRQMKNPLAAANFICNKNHIQRKSSSKIRHARVPTSTAILGTQPEARIASTLPKLTESWQLEISSTGNTNYKHHNMSGGICYVTLYSADDDRCIPNRITV